MHNLYLTRAEELHGALSSALNMLESITPTVVVSEGWLRTRAAVVERGRTVENGGEILQRVREIVAEEVTGGAERIDEIRTMAMALGLAREGSIALGRFLFDHRERTGGYDGEDYDVADLPWEAWSYAAHGLSPNPLGDDNDDNDLEDDGDG